MAIIPTLETHDVLISDGTTILGLILRKDEKGIPILTRYPTIPLAPQEFQTLGQEAFAPQQEAPFSVDTNHAGFGKERWVNKRYQVAYGTDASQKNRIKLSPVLVATTNTTATYSPAVSGTNLGFETSGLSGWTASGAPTIWVDSTTNPRTGSRHARAAWTLNANDVTTLRQALTTTTPELLPGTTLTIDLYTMYTTTAPGTYTVKIFSQSDYTNELASLTITPTTSYAIYTLSLAFTESYRGLYLQISLAAPAGAAGSVDLDDIAITLTGTTSNPTSPNTVVKLIDFNSAHYLVSDSGVWKRTAANWVRVSGSPPDIVDAVSDGTNLYLARGTSKDSWYMNTSEAFTAIRDDDTRCSHLAYINDTMYGITGATTLAKYTSFTAGTVANNYTVGETGYNVTALLSHLKMPYIVKENWAGYLNTGLPTPAIIEIAKELAGLFNTNTGKNSISRLGNNAQTLYIPAGSDATLWDEDAGNNIGPQEFQESLSDFDGQVVATASDDKYLYVVLDNGTKIEILKGRYETIDGSTDFRWHPILEDTYTTVGYAHISSITAKRLYYGGGTALPKYISLENDSYATGGTHLTCQIDLGLPNILKNWRSIAIRSNNLSATKTIKVEYKKDGDTSWTTIEGVTSGLFTTSPYQEVFFGSSSNGLNTRLLQLRFTLATDSTTVTPEILDWTLNYILKAPTLWQIELEAILSSSNLVVNTQAPDKEMSYSVVASTLRGWKDTIPLTLTIPDGLFTTSGHHDGEAIKVHIAPGGFKETVLQLPHNKPRIDMQTVIHLRCVEMRTS